MIVERIDLTDFRSYRTASFELTDGVTAIIGPNGHGKTNLVEALAYLATLESFRGAPDEALVRAGAETAILRASVRDDDGRRSSIEAEINRSGRNRVQVNRQRLVRSRDLLGVVRVSVFAPDDVMLIKSGPSERRRFLDDACVSLTPRFDATRLELERILRQRNRLVKQSGGRLSDDIAVTLDVWDARLAEVGTEIGQHRAALIEQLAPLLAETYEQIAGRSAAITLDYDAPWRAEGLAAALARARTDDLRRGVSTVGPHRDDFVVGLDGLAARVQSSQGEQRTLAIALRLATHRLITESVGSAPVLVLDDVLSELDPERAAALLAHVPPGQVVITTAAPLPPAAAPDRVLTVADAMAVRGIDPVGGR